MANNHENPNRAGHHNGDSAGFRPFFTSRKGRRFYARDYGYRSWPFGRGGGGKDGSGRPGK